MRRYSAVRLACLLALVTLAGCSQWSISGTGRIKERKTVEGEFVSPAGAEGPIGFGCEFDTPPNVVISAPFGLPPPQHTFVTEVTNTGFKWKNNGSSEKKESDLRVRWTAAGTVSK
jgi:hypothetical protein